ncbi:MAG TPA: hypothetical protein VGI39_23170 [Polyangiaceae bacterium]|jgi:hypothetical protein
MKLGLRTLPLALGLLATSCTPPRPPPPQGFAFHVSSDPNKPLSGARLLRDGKVVATSNGGGVASFQLDGRDGDTFDIAVDCPVGFQSPTQPVPVTLRRLASPEAIAEYEAACPPRTRAIVVAVKGGKGHRLPVMHLGEEIGRTDANGAATVLVRVGPQEQFDLALDTGAKEDSALRPQNPAATFTVKNRDEVLVFDPHFTEAKKPVPRAPRVTAPLKAVPLMPIRIQ